MTNENKREYNPNWPEQWPLPESLNSEDFFDWVRSLGRDGYRRVTEDVMEWLKKSPPELTRRVVNNEYGLVFDIPPHLLNDSPLNPFSDLYLIGGTQLEGLDNVIRGPWVDPEKSSE